MTDLTLRCLRLGICRTRSCLVGFIERSCYHIFQPFLVICLSSIINIKEFRLIVPRAVNHDNLTSCIILFKPTKSSISSLRQEFPDRLHRDQQFRKEFKFYSRSIRIYLKDGIGLINKFGKLK